MGLGDGTWSDALDSIEYTTNIGVDITNNSYGGYGYSQIVREAIEHARQEGILFIAAAGNDGVDNDEYPHYPASYDLANIISVAATDHDDARAYFGEFSASNYGLTSVDLGAPGLDILSTFPTYMTGRMAYYGLSMDYEFISGTSMACPHVAGACALLKSAMPDLPADQIKHRVLETTDCIDALDGITVTGGRLNLNNLLLTVDDCNADGIPDSSQQFDDCNSNGIPDPLRAGLQYKRYSRRL